MELAELIESYKLKYPDDKKTFRSLVKIQELDAKREDNLYKLSAKIDQLERGQRAVGAKPDPNLEEWLTAYRCQLDSLLKEHRKQFGNKLAEGLAPLGLNLKGQYPRLTAGLFTFILEFERGRCEIWYGPKQEKLTTTTLDVEKVIRSIQKINGNLGSGLEPDALIEKIVHAYQHVKLDSPDAPVKLPMLLPYMALQVQSKGFNADPLKRLYRDYGRADFSYDLYRLRSWNRPFRLKTATRRQTTRRADFLWVPSRIDVEGGDYFAIIELQEAKS